MIAFSAYARFAALFISRPDDYAVQGPHGLYRRTGHALTPDVLHRHLDGQHTIGAYVMNMHGDCSYAVMDADKPGGHLDVVCTTRSLFAHWSLCGFESTWTWSLSLWRPSRSWGRSSSLFEGL